MVCLHSYSSSLTFLLSLWVDSLLISKANTLWDSMVSSTFTVFFPGILLPHLTSSRLPPLDTDVPLGYKYPCKTFSWNPHSPLVTRLNYQCSCPLLHSAHSLLNPSNQALLHQTLFEDRIDLSGARPSSQFSGLVLLLNNIWHSLDASFSWRTSFIRLLGCMLYFSE